MNQVQKVHIINNKKTLVTKNMEINDEWYI
jgi:hypothetical protein